MTNSVAGVRKTFTGFLNWTSNSQPEREPFNDVLGANSDDDRAAPAAKRMKVQSEEDKTLFKIISSSGKGELLLVRAYISMASSIPCY